MYIYCHQVEQSASIAVCADTRWLSSTGAMLNPAMPTLPYYQVEQFVPVAVEDLAHLPCLVILTDNDRAGDTLPANLIAWDLRARHCNKEVARSAFIRDVGRVFGWRRQAGTNTPATGALATAALATGAAGGLMAQLPTLLLGKKAWKAFTGNKYGILAKINYLV